MTKTRKQNNTNQFAGPWNLYHGIYVLFSMWKTFSFQCQHGQLISATAELGDVFFTSSKKHLKFLLVLMWAQIYHKNVSNVDSK